LRQDSSFRWGRQFPGLGLQRNFRRNSSDKGNRSRNPPSAQHDHPDSNRRDRFGSRRVLSLATKLRWQGRQIDRSATFENLSHDPDNAYFADGIQDDILTNLSKIGDLKVIWRTSVMPYRGSGTRESREIRREDGSKSGRNSAGDPGE
jgi:hypothetical protein